VYILFLYIFADTTTNINNKLRKIWYNSIILQTYREIKISNFAQQRYLLNYINSINCLQTRLEIFYTDFAYSIEIKYFIQYTVLEVFWTRIVKLVNNIDVFRKSIFIILYFDQKLQFQHNIFRQTNNFLHKYLQYCFDLLLDNFFNCWINYRVKNIVRTVFDKLAKNIILI